MSPETITDPDRAALRESLGRLLAERCREADVRRVMATPEGFDRDLYQALAELGVVGLVIDPALGGAGAGPVELEQVMETAGAALLPGPLISSGVLAARLLQELGNEEARRRWLPEIAAGRAIATLAMTGPAGGWDEDGVTVTARGGRLSGEAAYVTSTQIADVLFVLARAEDGLAALEIAPGAPGVTVTPRPTFDRTLRLATVTLTDAPARLIASGAGVWPAVATALAWTLVAVAGEQAGGARRVLDMTVGYAKARHQFGRPIGGFQAIKHMAADLLLESESATSAARQAARALAAGDADAAAAVALAAFACADAYVTVCAAAIQMHGGVAFTWDHPAHLYLRRARADAQLFGGPDHHRERWLRLLEGGP